MTRNVRSGELTVDWVLADWDLLWEATFLMNQAASVCGLFQFALRTPEQ
jgi:hypothetical protein